MPREESLYPADWLRVADRDVRRVRDMLKADDPGAAGLFLQQAIEKFLKAFLLSRGWKLRRIHSLSALLDDAVIHEGFSSRLAGRISRRLPKNHGLLLRGALSFCR